MVAQFELPVSVWEVLIMYPVGISATCLISNAFEQDNTIYMFLSDNIVTISRFTKEPFHSMRLPILSCNITYNRALRLSTSPAVSSMSFLSF